MSEFTRTNNEELYAADSNKAMPIIIRYSSQNEDYHNRSNDFLFKDYISQIIVLPNVRTISAAS